MLVTTNGIRAMLDRMLPTQDPSVMLLSLKIDDAMRDHLMEELDYYILPEAAWSKLTSWYGLSQNSRPFAHKVVEHGIYIYTYLLEFKLCVHPNFNDVKPRSFTESGGYCEWPGKKLSRKSSRSI